jgi:hypothetical protein
MTLSTGSISKYSHEIQHFLIKTDLLVGYFHDGMTGNFLQDFEKAKLNPWFEHLFNLN